MPFCCVATVKMVLRGRSTEPGTDALCLPWERGARRHHTRLGHSNYPHAPVGGHGWGDRIIPHRHRQNATLMREWQANMCCRERHATWDGLCRGRVLTV
jgi:hypothetical protein